LQPKSYNYAAPIQSPNAALCRINERMKSPSVPLRDGVVAILQDDQGRYLLIKRGSTLTRAPGWWCFVGGEVEPGETLATAIEREAMEEVGLRVQAREEIHQSISPNGEYLLHWLRVAALEPLTGLRLHAVEVAEARWLTIAEVLRLDPLLPALRAWAEKQQANAAQS
jgi:8-oxo-dGTP diphosphatase